MSYNLAQAWIEHDSTSPVRLGYIPSDTLVFAPIITMPTTFNGSATAKVGTSTDDNAYGTSLDLTAAVTNYKEFTKGVDCGYHDTGANIIVTIGGTPTAGKALITVPFINLPPVP